MTTLEMITKYLLPICIALMFICFAYEINREIKFVKRKKINIVNYIEYSRYYDLHPNKILLSLYFAILIGFIICFIFDAIEKINHILLIPDLIFIIVSLFFVYHELSIGKFNKDLTTFSILYRRIQGLKKESNNFKELIKQNEKKKNASYSNKLKTINNYNSFVNIKIEEQELNKFFIPLNTYIANAYTSTLNYNKVLNNYFNQQISNYIIGTIQEDDISNYEKQIVYKQENFDEYFVDIEKEFKDIFDKNFILNIEDTSFKNEKAFFSAFKFCTNESMIYENYEIEIIKIFNSFDKHELATPFLLKNNGFNFQNAQIIGINIKTWWFIKGMFLTNLSKDKLAVIDLAINTDNTELIYKLLEFDFTISPATINHINQLRVNNYSLKCIESFLKVNSISCPLEYKINNLESKCIALLSTESKTFAKKILNDGSFVQNKTKINEIYNANYSLNENIYTTGKKILIDFMINYSNNKFEIDTNKIYEYFKECEFSLDYKNITYLSYFLLFLLFENNCPYEKVMLLTYDLKKVGSSDDTQKYINNVIEYLITQNNINFKRIVYRIENKRMLYDDLIQIIRKE